MVIFMFASALLAALHVVPTADGFAICRGATQLVSSVTVETDDDAASDVRTSTSESPRFGTVWNRWRERRDGRYRLEVASRPDGSVEITLAGEVSPYDKIRTRRLDLAVPAAALDGRRWKAYAGDGRRIVTSEGMWADDFRDAEWRFMETDGVVFDFNPLGAGDYCCTYQEGAVKGVWQISRRGDAYRFSGGSRVGRVQGGFTGAKVIVREGSFDDYARHHFVQKFHYSDHLAATKMLAFGMSRRGANYAEGNVSFEDGRDFGWTSPAAARSFAKGDEEGVLYSAVRGRDGRYRLSGLANGWYVLTLAAGNYAGVRNAFSASVNGEAFVPKTSVARGTARQFAKAVHVASGALELVLDGDFLLSSLALQPVLGDAEDFSVGRGFWCTDGYEPATIYRNAETNAPPAFRLSDETYDLPKPGTETAGVWREPPAPVLRPDPDAPSLAWLRDVSIARTLRNSATLAELDDADDRRRFLGNLLDGRRDSAVMISGMHSRHTYEAHLDRGVEAIRRLAEEVHRRGRKLIDHHDATLLWNVDAGFRVLLERVPELQRSRPDGLPAFQLCPNNPDFKEKYYAYLRRLVEAGVDGFQLDEVMFFADRCVCAACRDRFFRETGWRIPANELDRDFADPRSLLRKRWHAWRVRTTGNWFVELRRRLMDVKPDLVLNMYTTHWGFTTSNPSFGTSNDLMDLSRTVNLFGTEVMPRNPLLSARAILAHRRTKHLLNKASDLPVWAWYYGTGAEQAYFCWAVTKMCGQIPLLPDFAPEPGVPNFEAFDASPAPGATPLARVALFFSTASRDWGPNWSTAAEHLGTAQALDARHVPYEVLGEASLDATTLAKYRVLFVGESECLSDAQIATIRDFARHGGKVRLGRRAGTRDEIGELRPVWPFADLFPRGPETDASAPVVAKTLGKGEVVYDPTGRGRTFEFKELGVRDVNRFQPDARAEAAFRDELEAWTRDATVWRTDAPERVYTSLWRERGGDVVIYFLNAQGGVPPVGVVPPAETPKPAFPPLGRDITFAVKSARDVRVTARSPDFDGERELVWTRLPDGSLTVTLPQDLLRVLTIVRLSPVSPLSH